MNSLEAFYDAAYGGRVGSAAKIKNSIFGTPAFKSLPIKEQAVFIHLHIEALDHLSHYGLEYLATILLRAQCSCALVLVYYDESTDELVECEGTHDSDCHLKKYPINEDLSESTLRRRQRMEMLASPETLRLLEEEAHGINGLRDTN